MRGRVFKHTLFGGYQRESVNTYFGEVNKKLENELAGKNAIIAEKDAIIAELQAKNAELMQQQENVDIADHIIKRAHVQAKKVANGATEELEARRERIQNQIKQERAKLRVLQAEVAGLQRLAHDAAAKFSGELAMLDVESAD